MGALLAAAALFVGTHFLLSHPLRAPLVARVGERGFLGLYSLVAFGMLGWLSSAFRHAPGEAPWWPAGDALWAAASLVMLVASVLLVGSLVSNPALATFGAPATAPGEARGVYAVTRHPMLWAFALWSGVHFAVLPMTATLILTVAIATLSLVGAALQDRKKERFQPQLWLAWEAKTSFWPFAAIVSGRARFGRFRAHELAGGVVLWLAATAAHWPLAGAAAGVWRWV